MHSELRPARGSGCVNAASRPWRMDEPGRGTVRASERPSVRHGMRKTGVSMAPPNDNQATGADQAATDAFTGRMVSMLNDAAVALLVTIGHQTSLFDLLATLPPANSTEIADTAGLDERVCAGMVGGSHIRSNHHLSRVISYLCLTGPSRRGSHTCRRREERRQGRAPHRHPRSGRAEDHRLFPQWRRFAVLGVSAVPRGARRRGTGCDRRQPRR